MKIFVTLAAAATLSALSIAAPAQAAPWNNLSGAIEAVQSGEYTVKRIDALDDSKAYNVNARASQQADDVQSAIRSNPSLLRDLTGRNVQIGNVVGASVAANGGVTFYLR